MNWSRRCGSRFSGCRPQRNWLGAGSQALGAADVVVQHPGGRAGPLGEGCGDHLGSVSIRNTRGATPRRVTMRSSSPGSPSAVIDLSTRPPTHSRVRSSTAERILIGRPSVVESYGKSIAHTTFGASEVGTEPGSRQTDPRVRTAGVRRSAGSGRVDYRSCAHVEVGPGPDAMPRSSRRTLVQRRRRPCSPRSARYRAARPDTR